MKNTVIYVHGKGGSAKEAERYKPLFQGAEVIGFDYRAETPWYAKEEFSRFFAEQRRHCDSLTLIANSIGAFFTMNSQSEALIDKAYFISPHSEYGKSDRQYDEMGGSNGRGACGKVTYSYGIRRNALVGVSLLCAKAPDHMARSHTHFVRRAG